MNNDHAKVKLLNNYAFDLPYLLCNHQHGPGPPWGLRLKISYCPSPVPSGMIKCVKISCWNLDYIPHFKGEKVASYRNTASVPCKFAWSCYRMNNEWRSVGDPPREQDVKLRTSFTSHASHTFWTQTPSALGIIVPTVRWHFEKPAAIRLWHGTPSQVPHRPADDWEVLVRRPPVRVFLHEQQQRQQRRSLREGDSGGG